MSTPSIDQLRFNMIEQQIRPWDVLDPQVLELLGTIHREDCVPPAHKALAFVDMEVPLQGEHDQAVRLGQIMLSPKVEGRLLQEVNPRRHETVLEVGAGSGYITGATVVVDRLERGRLVVGAAGAAVVGAAVLGATVVVGSSIACWNVRPFSCGTKPRSLSSRSGL